MIYFGMSAPASMGNLCEAQHRTLEGFTDDVQALFAALLHQQPLTEPAALALNGAKAALGVAPLLLKIQLVQNWIAVSREEKSLRDMLESDYLDVPNVITGRQMLEMYNAQPPPQQAVITQAFETTVASCKAFAAATPPQPQ